MSAKPNINLVLTDKDKTILLSRLKAQTKYVGKCWLFTGARATRGYRKLQYKRKRILTHRLSAAIHLGLDINGTLQANHKLICTDKSCWNPDHLYIGTQADNMIDVRTLILESERFCHKGHLISGVIYIKGKIRKICNECRNERYKTRYSPKVRV